MTGARHQMSCTNNVDTCSRFDCPLKGSTGANCMWWCIAHHEELEEAQRAFEIEFAKRNQTRRVA